MLNRLKAAFRLLRCREFFLITTQTPSRFTFNWDMHPEGVIDRCKSVGEIFEGQQQLMKEVKNILAKD